MLNKDAKLSDTIFTAEVEKKSTRDGFGKGVVEAGKEDPTIVVLSADLGDSTRAAWFQKEFPDRFVEVGVAEQNLATVASGMAHGGKIPFICSYAAFSPGRNYEQIRTTIALNNVPVKVCGMHAGIQTGPDGATHEMLEDISLMRALPNMTVIVPADAEEGRKATVAAAKSGTPVYLRFGRANEPIFTTPETPFEIGKAVKLWESEKPQVAIMTTGSIAYNALQAAKALQEAGVGSVVLNVHTVKPLDGPAILDAAKKTGRVLTCEEHQVNGGFGGAIAEFLCENYPVPLHRLGLQDEFGQSGDPDELAEHYGLGAKHIEEAARALINRA